MGTALAEQTTKRISIAPKAQATILEEVTKGRNLSTAARIAGIAPQKLLAALNDAERSDNKHPLYYFARDVYKAEAEFEGLLQDELLAAARKENKWQGYMTYLERRYRQNWVQPTAKAEKAGAVSIGFVEKMAIVNNADTTALPSGD